MIKHIAKNTNIVFEEIPDRVSLGLSITNCCNMCEGCHSGFLRLNIGEELTEDYIIENYDNLIKHCNCVLFLGEGNDRKSLLHINEFVKNHYNIETAIYSGRDSVEDDFFKVFDFVKVGSYKKECGPLNQETTNQRLYYHGEDITYKFWNRK